MALDDGSVRRVLYESVAPIQQRHLWEKKFTHKTNFGRSLASKPFFFLGWQGLGCSFPGYFSQEGVGGKNPLLQKS